MILSTTKLLPETKRLAKQQAAARGMFLYDYLQWLVNMEILATQPDANELIREFKRVHAGLVEIEIKHRTGKTERVMATRIYPNKEIKQ